MKFIVIEPVVMLILNPVHITNNILTLDSNNFSSRNHLFFGPIIGVKIQLVTWLSI